MNNSLRANSWLNEFIFILCGLATGVASQFQWFSISKWDPSSSSLLDFAVRGGWQNYNMPNRLMAASIFTVVVFYLMNKFLNFCLQKLSFFQMIQESYLKHNKLFYSVFLLSWVGLFGIYLDSSFPDVQVTSSSSGPNYSNLYPTFI